MQERNIVMNMSSTIDRRSSLKLQLFSTTQYAILSRPYDENHVEWYLPLGFEIRLIVYASLLAMLVIVIYLVLKFLGDFGNDGAVEQPVATETNRLLPKKVISFTYGTCEGDLESGKGSSSSSDDLYDRKICIICYDEQRNCFFVPCGHCATCHVCAHRIIDGESKTCPVCRRFIHRVKKLFTSRNQTTEQNECRGKLYVWREDE